MSGQDKGVAATPPGCEPTASAASASSQGRIPNAELLAMSDEELSERVRLEAYLAVGRRHCVHDDNCTDLYREAGRRGKMWLYSRGWNRFYEDAGGTLTASDRRAANPESGGK